MHRRAPWLSALVLAVSAVAAVAAARYVSLPSTTPEAASIVVAGLAAALVITLGALAVALTALVQRRTLQTAAIDERIQDAVARSEQQYRRVIEQVEQELERAREAAEKASVAKSEFLRSMSHDMRTPLNGVLGLMDLLSATDLDEQQARYVAVARASTTHLSVLIADILDLSRLEAGSLTLERQPYDLPALIQSTLDVVATRANAKRLNVSCRVEPAVPTWVVGDPGRLRQVIVNLLTNAVKFTERGDIELQASADAEPQSRRALVRITVRDTGIGMEPGQVERLFPPFADSGASEAGRYAGTGLGLTICKRLLDAMGGTIDVASVEHAGSSFTVTLPIEVADAALIESHREDDVPRQVLAASPGHVDRHERAAMLSDVIMPASVGSTTAVTDASKTVEMARPLRVLVAEDDAVNQLVVQDLLQSMRCEVTLVANGEDAVAAVLATPFDVVLMDCQMPILDGVEATRRIRSAHAEGRTAHAPRIVALTANATEDDRRVCLDAGMDAYLAKPMRAAVLQRTLQRLKAGEAAAARGDRTRRPLTRVVESADHVPFIEAPDAEDILDPNEILLRCNRRPDLGARMLRLFAESLPADLAALESAAAANDLATVGHLAHRMRGAAATLAAARLTGAIAGIELFLKYGDGGPLAELVAEVRHESALLLGVVPQTLRRLGTAPASAPPS